MDEEKDSITNGAGSPSPNAFTCQGNTVMVGHRKWFGFIGPDKSTPAYIISAPGT